MDRAMHVGAPTICEALVTVRQHDNHPPPATMRDRAVAPARSNANQTGAALPEEAQVSRLRMPRFSIPDFSLRKTELWVHVVLCDAPAPHCRRRSGRPPP
eukprot:Polyplicarium_translucidae@DN3066_c0_g1_i9.p2